MTETEVLNRGHRVGIERIDAHGIAFEPQARLIVSFMDGTEYVEWFDNWCELLMYVSRCCDVWGNVPFTYTTLEDEEQL